MAALIEEEDRKKAKAAKGQKVSGAKRCGGLRCE